MSAGMPPEGEMSLFDMWRVIDKENPLPRRVKMQADYESNCPLCGEDIEIGDNIEKMDGEWCHGGCVDEYRDGLR